MTLNPQQQEAYDQFRAFLVDPQQTMFCLLGRAGTGKSFTAAQMFDLIREHKAPLDEMIWAAPTWKAVRVSSGFLQKMGVPYEIGYDYFMHRAGKVICTTTQQSLGVRPIIKEDQGEEVEFGEAGGGILRKLRPRFVVIDEVSMLSWRHLKSVYEIAQEIGAKVLVIGDPGQLPPVKEAEIKWDKIPNRYELKTIMRQSGDSMIPVVAGMVRDGDAGWRDVTQGQGIVRADNAAASFLSVVGRPSEDEGDRDVFVAYRNALVDRVQDAACREVYGHGMDEFREGEPVIAQSALYANRAGMVIANQDELVVEKMLGRGVWGERVDLRLKNGRVARAEYLPGTEMASGPWADRLKELKRAALDLQTRFKAGERSIDKDRRRAWVAFFEHKDQTVLNFSHPFAITSHKSQGSTYRRAFVAAQDISRFDERGLYVAMTRPKEELVY